MRGFSLKRVVNFFNSVRPLIDKDGEVFLRNLNDDDFEEKIKSIKKGKAVAFNTGEKDFKINLVRNLDSVIE